MIVLRCGSSEKDMAALVRESGSIPCALLFLKPDAVKTGKELEFAFYLAKEAFKNKGNISGKIANEALLFLSCQTNFSSAVKKIGATDGGDFLLACEKDIPLAELKKALRLEKAEKMKLPEWGKKRGAYSEGELAVEKMALARIRN